MARKILGIMLNVLITIAVLIILFVTYSSIQTKLLKKDYTNLLGYTVFQVATGSMSPTMEVKDIVLVKVLSEEQRNDLQIGDIIVFKQHKSIITHRIVEIKQTEIVTRGDANNAKDAPIKEEAIIGKVVKTIPNIGIWEQVFTTPKVYISIIITITLLGITFSFNQNNKEEKKELQMTKQEIRDEKRRKNKEQMQTKEELSKTASVNISGEKANEKKQGKEE